MIVLTANVVLVNASLRESFFNQCDLVRHISHPYDSNLLNILHQYLV